MAATRRALIVALPLVSHCCYLCGVAAFSLSSVKQCSRQHHREDKDQRVALFSVADETAASAEAVTSLRDDEPATPSSSSSATITLADRTRPDFEILRQTVTEKDRPLIYMDSGATSQKPRQVIEAIDDYYQRYNSNVHRGAHTLSRLATTAYEEARDAVAQFVNAPSRDEIVFTSGATEALNLLCQTHGRTHLKEPKSRVLLTVAEHHANLVPWQMLQEELQTFEIDYVKIDPDTGLLDMKHFESLLTRHTKVVGFQHVSNVMGFCNPVREMVQLVRQKCHSDAVVVLDACQSVPHMTVDVQELGIDFLAASGHKMCGPTGIGFLWGRLDLMNAMPPFQGGGEMIDQVTLNGSTYLPSPARFEAGTPPIAQAVGLRAAIEYLQNACGGMRVIADYEHELADYLYQSLSAVPGITVLGPVSKNKKTGLVQRASLCAFVHETIHPSDLSTFLDMEGVAVRAGHHCCQPLHAELGYSHSIRASLSFYNTKEEIDAFIRHLRNTIKFFTDMQDSDDDAEESANGTDSDDFVPFV